jgi:hypothetical protein
MKIMGRSLIVAAAFGAFAAAGGQAQTIGFKLGPSFSTISTDEPGVDVSTLTKFTGGGFIRFAMGGLAIQPELMYVTKGAKTTFGEGGVSVDGELRLDYIEVPLLVVVPFSAGGSISPFVYGGPALAFEVGCTIAISAAGFDGSSDCDEEDEGLDRKKMDVGAMFGGGVAIPMGPGAITLEGRYNFGLINLNDSTEGGSIKNRSGAVLVGYAIPLGMR